jgi:ATP-dependent 26S proteasome regulatory subunit
MTDPITTLGLAKSASVIVKEALDYARQSKNSDLAEKLVDAYRDIVELDDTNRQLKRDNEKLKEEITELKRKPEMAAKLIYEPHSSGYMVKEDNGSREGPYCTTCWDVEGRLVRLKNMFPGWQCIYCAKR